MKTTLNGQTSARALAKKADLYLAPHDGQLVHGIEEILQRYAAEERNTHEYRNQTGHLQQSTRAQVVDESDDYFEAHLEMGEEYASHVVDRGYSNFRNIGGKAAAEVQLHMHNVGKILSR